MATTIAKRLVATFIGASIPNVLVGTLVDVAVWKSAVMAGAVAVLGVLQSLAESYADGKLTFDEIEDAFKQQ
jgi:hypothetical protein